MTNEKLDQLKLKHAFDVLYESAKFEKRILDEITELRKHVKIIAIRNGYLECEGPYGRAVANKKEVTLYNPKTGEPLKYDDFRKHLYARHTALVWAVIGYADNSEA